MNKREFDKLLESLGKAKLVAVSKSVDTDAVAHLASFGQVDFGENRVQELSRKITALGGAYNALKWHFIGRLQTNKINALLALRPALWQSCESVEAALSVDKRLDYDLEALLQINSANEESKQGVEINKAIDIYSEILERTKHLKLVGVMCIGAHENDQKAIIKSFESTYKIFESLAKKGAKICSMGMSDDYEIALKTGSNMLRLGRILW